MLYILILWKEEVNRKKKKKLNCRYALYKQMRSYSRTLWSGDGYHIKGKLPVGYIILTEVTCLPFQTTFVYFCSLSLWAATKVRFFKLTLTNCQSWRETSIKHTLSIILKGFDFLFSWLFFFYFGCQVTKECEVSKGLTVNISTMRCITV